MLIKLKPPIIIVQLFQFFSYVLLYQPFLILVHLFNCGYYFGFLLLKFLQKLLVLHNCCHMLQFNFYEIACFNTQFSQQYFYFSYQVKSFKFYQLFNSFHFQKKKKKSSLFQTGFKNPSMIVQIQAENN